jgi:ATP-dependent Clp protease ATP-binding subunit ClpC
LVVFCIGLYLRQDRSSTAVVGILGSRGLQETVNSKLDRFTKRARRVLSLAQEEAQRLGHGYIGTEHLLLGLVSEQGSVAARILRDLRIEPDKIRSVVEETITPGHSAIAGELELSPRTKQVIELAVDEARRMGSRYVGTEHLLLGVLREGEGIAAGILGNIGVDIKKVRRKLVRILQDRTDSSSARSDQPQRKGEPASVLDELSTDLTELAREGKLDPVIGRQKEIERVIQILARRTKNNPALIGEPGVGKTAIVEALAQRIVSGEVPHDILNKRVVMLDVGSLVAGTMYRGQFEERLKKVISEIKDTESILFIDELHMLVGAGSAGSSVDAANILKPALARGELQCVGATTLGEYRKHIEGDAALERRFQPIVVEEPTVDETIDILRGVVDRYEAHHRLSITDESLCSAARLASRYVSDRYLPDKAIDLMDEAASRVRIYKAPSTGGLKEAFQKLTRVRQEKELAFEAQEYEVAASLRDKERSLSQELEQLQLGWDSPDALVEGTPLRVTPDDIAEVVSMWTGVPAAQIAEEESSRLLRMEEALHQRVVGQDEAIASISKAVRRARAGLKDPQRPIGSFIFLGPTGVGKTELAKALAEFLFGSEDALVQLDMSEFMERHSVARLVGAPPGYVGYEEAGQLTEAIRRHPYSIICFDEVEKAHPEAFNMLLQIMEEGHLSDAKGHKVDFRNAIIVMTSNVGADIISRECALGFRLTRDEAQSAEQNYQEMREKVLEQLKKTFRPEFLNRVDGVVVFRALSREQIKEIAGLMLSRIQDRLEEHVLALDTTEEAHELIAEKGYDPVFGARPLRRTIQDLIEDPLSEGMLSGKFKEGDLILADREGDEVVFRVKEKEEQTNPLPA